MITYQRGGAHFFLKVFQCKGSVFPFAFFVASPCAAATFGLKWYIDRGELQAIGDGETDSILRETATWSGFMFLVGFLIVFRTSQAYARFWDGCTSTHQMRAEWFDACSALVAFCKHSKAGQDSILIFQHTVVRLFSMLHAAALAEIEDSSSDDVEEVAAFKYELVDVAGIDAESIRAVKESDCKVELVFQWIQQLIVENIDTGVLTIPAPILSRAFQEIANGMCQFHEAIKIATIPFPFPYAQTCDCLLIMHWLVTPLVVSQWVSAPSWGALFSFIQVFIYWCLNLIAVEIEQPFGMDANDIDASTMQLEMNRHLLLLIQPQTKRTPRLSCRSVWNQGVSPTMADWDRNRRQSFSEVWSRIDTSPLLCPPPAPARTIRARSPSKDPSGGRRPSVGSAYGDHFRPSMNSLFGENGRPSVNSLVGATGSSMPDTVDDEVGALRRPSLVSETGMLKDLPGGSRCGGKRLSGRSSFGEMGEQNDLPNNGRRIPCGDQESSFPWFSDFPEDEDCEGCEKHPQDRRGAGGPAEGERAPRTPTPPMPEKALAPRAAPLPPDQAAVAAAAALAEGPGADGAGSARRRALGSSRDGGIGSLMRLAALRCRPSLMEVAVQGDAGLRGAEAGSLTSL